MWPFTHSRAKPPIPAIQCGDVLVHWNAEFHWWEFTAAGIDFSLCENPVFDPAIVEMVATVTDWLAELDGAIDQEIQTHLEGWCESSGEKHLVGVDVSWLVEKREIDAAYAHDNWGDLAVNVVIADGAIKHSYAGD